MLPDDNRYKPNRTDEMKWNELMFVQQLNKIQLYFGFVSYNSIDQNGHWSSSSAFQMIPYVASIYSRKMVKVITHVNWANKPSLEMFFSLLPNIFIFQNNDQQLFFFSKVYNGIQLKNTKRDKKRNP